MNNQLKIVLVFFVGILPFLFNGLLNSQLLPNYIIIYWVFEFIFWIFLPFFVFIYSLRNNLIDFSIFGYFNTNKFVKEITFIVFVSIGFFLIYFISQKLSHIIFMENYFTLSFQYHDTIPKNQFLKLVVITYHSISAGFVEEFYYRGLLGVSIKGKKYILISSSFFSIVHWENGIYTMFPAFIVGILAAWIYYKYKKLWPLIIGHSITDFIYYIIW
ncbi:MAG: CPBP family intramembrane metalloprotease [Calditrichaceae bacterium]|nr:CPBP family intramembrane metalloprotease [Calditrichaceae bacterium]MBN2708090.1 CPBP family intramembrane metalloprotease [Calditrichaceae bacterium]RQV95143.1 MAG: CPBP family intramembrane metalloprotease [Calditrichota bacterium]